MRSLIVKLVEKEEDGGGDGGPPLVVRAAVHPTGHLFLVWLLRCWDLLPCKPQLEAVLLAHLQQIKKDPIGSVVIQAYAGSV